MIHFEGAYYGYWTVFFMAPDECHRPDDVFRNKPCNNVYQWHSLPVRRTVTIAFAKKLLSAVSRAISVDKGNRCRFATIAATAWLQFLVAASRLVVSSCSNLFSRLQLRRRVYVQDLV